MKWARVCTQPPSWRHTWLVPAKAAAGPLLQQQVLLSCLCGTQAPCQLAAAGQVRPCLRQATRRRPQWQQELRLVGTAVAWGSHQQLQQQLQCQQQVVRPWRRPCCRAWATQVCLQWPLPGPWPLQLQQAAARPQLLRVALPVTLVWAAGVAPEAAVAMARLLPVLLGLQLLQRHVLQAAQLAVPLCQATGLPELPRVGAPRAAAATAARVLLCAAAAATVPPGHAASSSSSSTKQGAQEQQQQGLTHLLARVLRQQ